MSNKCYIQPEDMAAFGLYLVNHDHRYISEPTKGEWEVARYRSLRHGDDPIIIYKNKHDNISISGKGADHYMDWLRHLNDRKRG